MAATTIAIDCFSPAGTGHHPGRPDSKGRNLSLLGLTELRFPRAMKRILDHALSRLILLSWQ
jgi:hypothetical protein